MRKVKCCCFILLPRRWRKRWAVFGGLARCRRGSIKCWIWMTWHAVPTALWRRRLKNSDGRRSVKASITIEVNTMPTKIKALNMKDRASPRKGDVKRPPSIEKNSHGQLDVVWSPPFKPAFSKAFFDFMDEMDTQTRQRREEALRIIRAHKA